MRSGDSSIGFLRLATSCDEHTWRRLAGDLLKCCLRLLGAASRRRVVVCAGPAGGQLVVVAAPRRGSQFTARDITTKGEIGIPKDK